MNEPAFSDEPRVVRCLFTVRCFEGPLDGTLLQIEVAGRLELPDSFGGYVRDRTETGLPKVDYNGNPAYMWAPER